MAAFEELVARHRDKIYARAYSMMRNEDEALDLSQEAWVKGLAAVEAVSGRIEFRHLDDADRHQPLPRSLRQQNGSGPSPSRRWRRNPAAWNGKCRCVTVNPTERLERAELRQRIDQALGQLSHEHRTVLVLHEFEEMEYKEIAKAMDCSIGTVMSRLFYARRKLAALLAKLEKRNRRDEHSHGRQTMNEHAQLKLQAYLDGELPAGERQAVADRLASDVTPAVG